jgi:hypothetical protein
MKNKMQMLDFTPHDELITKNISALSHSKIDSITLRV